MLYELSVTEGMIFSSFGGVHAECAWGILEKTTTVSRSLGGTSVAHTLIHMAEICYRIRYPIRNNRNRGDPFSMRQIGICQKSCGPQNSTWMILQPSPEVLNRLELTIAKSESISVQKWDPMSLHLIILKYQSIHWDDYVENLRETLEPLVCFPSGQ